MSKTGIRTGKRGEEIAAAFLRDAGYRILDRNYRCPFGEIDLVAEESGSLVFVEVKSRRTDGYGPPQLAVDRRKREKISRSSLCYLSEKHLRPGRVRFDVVAVRMTPAGDRVELIRNAFEYTPF